jgi:hypothetical protein
MGTPFCRVQLRRKYNKNTEKSLGAHLEVLATLAPEKRCGTTSKLFFIQIGKPFARYSLNGVNAESLSIQYFINLLGVWDDVGTILTHEFEKENAAP